MQPKELLDNLSTHLKNAIAKAISLATSLGHAKVMSGHILVGLLEEEGAISSEILKKAGLERDLILTLLRNTITEQDLLVTSHVTTIPELNATSKKALERAMLLAYEREHNYIGTEHLLFGLLLSEDELIALLFSKIETKKETILEQLEHMLESTSKFPDIEDVSDMLDGLQSIIEDAAETDDDVNSEDDEPVISKGKKKKKNKHRPKAIDLFAVELTNEERQKNIDPVIGRADEIEQLIHILSRRTKNNPVLVGEPGVGKTAIIEGLAKRILEGDVPDVLRDKRVFSLDLTLLISGTIYRGEFEARLKQLIDESAANSDYLLFIDEIHNIIGAGSNQGTMDAANILKPALARGQLRCIGATTLDEFKKFISSDAALERRFQKIVVEEPSSEEAIKILSGVKKYYEKFHETNILEEAIVAAVELSTKYIHGSFLPDKAIDLIDEASAAVRVKQKPTVFAKKMHELRQQKKKLEERKEEAIHDEEFEKALKYKTAVEGISNEIRKLKKEKKKKKTTPKKVTAEQVATILSKKLHIDKNLLLANEWERLETLEKRLKTHVVGQDMVIEEIVNQIKQAQLGIGRKKKPLASFLFTGPSGVGKTKLAQALAEELYLDPKALIRIDMSEFAEAHGVSKLLGSPAGYIGYKERNTFLDQINTRPYCVVLFDEFDKAHADVQKLLYQILDEGTLTDGSGKKISFQHATIILTSNVGAELYHRSNFGFGDAQSTSKQQALKEHIHDKLKEMFGSAFLGRIKGVCIFSPLSKKHTELIVKKHIQELSKELLAAQNIAIKADTKALSLLAEKSFDKDFGVRNLEHTVDQVIQSLVISILKEKGDNKRKKYTLSTNKSGYILMP